MSSSIARLTQALRAHRVPIAAGVAVFVGAAIAFRLVRHAWGFWTIDDAGITYAQALALVDHHTVAANLEGTPVEGYSNPIVFFVTALLHVFGLFDPITTHLHIETLLFATMVTLAWSMLRHAFGAWAALAGAVIFAVVELATIATALWYGSGLENVWVACGLVALVWICARTARGVPLAPAWGNVAFVVAITRPESPVHVVAFYAALLLLARPADLAFRVHARRVGRALLVTIALYLAFLAWRRLAYEAWWPNTYYAKLHEHRPLGVNLRDYVVRGILPYGQSALFALCVVALACIPRCTRLAALLGVFLLAALALPVTAGADWMGEHRFATAFLATSHLAYATLVAAGVARLVVRPRRIAHAFAMAGLLAIAGLLALEHRTIPLPPVTIGVIAYGEGAQRWEQQLRLGVPYPVVLVPDAGGTLLVGAMQMLDNGYLTDFQMARIGRRYETPRDARVLNQYQNAERRPDLVTENAQFPHDRSLLGTTYLPPSNGVLWPRHDLVEVASLDGATLLHDGGTLKLYLSPETVRTAVPGALVRCEIIVSWTAPLDGKLRARIEGGDRDEVTLFPYQRSPVGFERFGLLLGAPARTGTYVVSLEIERGGKVTPIATAFTIEVTHELAGAIALARSAPPEAAARRFAWLREQAVPRDGMTRFHDHLAALGETTRHHTANAGALVMALRANARPAALAGVPRALRDAEPAVVAALFATCPDTPPRIACTGRVVDRLRRLGYFGVRVPHAREALADLAPADRYRALVGATLADPGDIALQWALLRLRRRLAAAGELPAP